MVYITTEELLTLLWKEAGRRGMTEERTFQDFLGRGLRSGFLQSADLTESDTPIQRRRLSGILHEYLKRECGEWDEPEWGSAGSLRDLYDCRTCVNHVAQMYAKGIVGAVDETRRIFGMREPVEYREAEESVLRMFEPTRRRKPGKGFDRQERAEGGPDREGRGQELLLPESLPPSGILLDVRTEGEFLAGHPDGAVNIPLLCLMGAPQVPGAGRDTVIYAYCDGGYRAEMAAQCLREAGYTRVFASRSGTEERTSGGES